MKKLLLLAGIFSYLFTFNAGAKEKTGELDTLVMYWFSQLKFNGTVVVAQDDDVLLHKGYGPRDVNQDSACDENTIYQIGHSTEMFTAAVIYKLQEQGKLSTKNTVSKYYPDYPKGDSITLEHLLSHTSGIFDFIDDDSFFNAGLYGPRSRKDIVLTFREKPLLFSPGSKYDYSSSNYTMLGYIIEEVTGKTYYQAVRDMIFYPLGMTSSGFGFSQYPSWDKAMGYHILNATRIVPALAIDSTIGYAATGAYSTSSDLYKWVKALMKNEFISEASKMEMLKLTSGGTEYNHGYGITTVYGDTAYESLGEASGMICNIIWVPATEYIAILLSNDIECETDYIRRDLLAILYDKPYSYPERVETVIMYPDQLLAYTGIYEMDEGYDLHFYVLHDVLYGEVKGQDEFTIYPVKGKRDHFILTSADVSFRFFRDQKDKVTGVIFRKNRREYKGVKWQ